MSVFVYSPDPAKLLSAFQQALSIPEGQADALSWVQDADGDLTHRTPRWGGRMFFKTFALEDKLEFRAYVLKTPAGETLTTPLEDGVYHGQLVQTLVSHFAGQYSRIEVIHPVKPGVTPPSLT